MKNIFLITCIALLFIACNKTAPKTVAEKIAHAHGIENWKNVSEIQFTFNVDKDKMHFERIWHWEPQTNQVTHIRRIDTVQYSRTKVDSSLAQTDRGFINDKLWLLAPFQLVWDKNITFSEATKAEAPISKLQLNQITVTYQEQVGDTPGDAYDIFYDDDYIIQEWIYRKGNQQEPTLTTTFENYQDFKGLKLPLEHKKQKGSWSVNYTNVKVITN